MRRMHPLLRGLLGLLVVAALVGGAIVAKNRALHHHAPKVVGPATADVAMCDWQAKTRDPLYLLPHVEKLDLTSKKSFKILQKKLDHLEPRGAAGKVQVGYMLGALPLASYSKASGEWKLDLTGFKLNLEKAGVLGRPFGIYVMSNHFQPRTRLVEELLDDPRNVMTYQDGTQPAEGYFNANLVPFTLSSDESVPVVHYTFDSMRQIAATLAEFDKAHPGLLVGIAVNGETHELFQDFYSGTGNFDHPRLTDFGPTAMREFQRWLDKKGIHAKAEAVRSMSFERNPAGYLPVSGWVFDAAGAPERVTIYVDGEPVAPALFPINRLDAYEDISRDVKTPNTGFNYLLDTESLGKGGHTLQAVAEFAGGRKIEVGRRLFWTGEGEAGKRYLEGLPAIVRPMDGALDVPTNAKHIEFQPLAREWMEFRAEQIAGYVHAAGMIFRDAGFPRAKVFSYQLAPWMFGNWNETLFGIGRDFFMLPDITPGINLYGGNMLSTQLAHFMTIEGGYGVPEMHPQMDNSADFSAKALRYHYCQGARYISPYFLKLDDKKTLTDHDRFRLDEANKAWGSDGFTHAIIDFAKE